MTLELGSRPSAVDWRVQEERFTEVADVLAAPEEAEDMMKRLKASIVPFHSAAQCVCCRGWETHELVQCYSMNDRGDGASREFDCLEVEVLEKVE